MKKKKKKIKEKLKLVMGRVENIVEKGENVAYQHFSFSNNVFKSLFVGVVKWLDGVIKSFNPFPHNETF